eukprot:CAMPEP_0119307510 /NCGR_PEP_ID=MMETSP1333-20130426/7986_1 /TAXON_ID=418940 /ORGANISM="Scyphosphaera apsteinii, Strain RCC1455" /LENGTH=404 /DNA_ID=CAMNT_0007311067 /DNA_START=75 /DNA_END=1286 /DNA_ORIENTATION=-
MALETPSPHKPTLLSVQRQLSPASQQQQTPRQQHARACSLLRSRRRVNEQFVRVDEAEEETGAPLRSPGASISTSPEGLYQHVVNIVLQRQTSTQQIGTVVSVDVQLVKLLLKRLFLLLILCSVSGMLRVQGRMCAHPTHPNSARLFQQGPPKAISEPPARYLSHVHFPPKCLHAFTGHITPVLPIAQSPASTLANGSFRFSTSYLTLEDSVGRGDFFGRNGDSFEPGDSFGLTSDFSWSLSEIQPIASVLYVQRLPRSYLESLGPGLRLFEWTQQLFVQGLSGLISTSSTAALQAWFNSALLRQQSFSTGRLCDQLAFLLHSETQRLSRMLFAAPDLDAVMSLLANWQRTRAPLLNWVSSHCIINGFYLDCSNGYLVPLEERPPLGAAIRKSLVLMWQRGEVW